MLTADLLRVTIRSGVVRPTFLKGKNDRARVYAAKLTDLYARSIGKPREDVEDAIRDMIGDAPDFLLARGLAKLLDDRSEWRTEVAVDPVELRAALYDAAFAARTPAAAAAAPVLDEVLDRTQGGTQDGALDRTPASAPLRLRRRPRAEVVDEVAARFGITPVEVDAAMFADLRSQECLIAYDPIEVDELLARYDVSLAQAVLLRAVELELVLERATSGQLRAFFQMLKFHQLLFEARRDEQGHWVIRVDGPLNILQRSGRYGVQLAQALLPLLHFERWRLDATLRWPGRDEPLTFALSAKDRLIPVGRLRGAWVSSEQELLVSRLAEAPQGWSVADDVEIIELGGRDVLVPSLVLRHADGREAFVEIVGTWRRDWLRRRLEALRSEGPPNLVLCVSRTLAARHETLGELEGEVVEFAQVISLPRVLAAADRVGIARGGGRLSER